MPSISLKVDNSDPAATDYSEILASVKQIAEQILAEYNDNKFGAGIDLAEKIGALYAPSDDSAADRIANLVKMVVSTMYFGGVEFQIKENHHQRMNQLASYTPPF